MSRLLKCLLISLVLANEAFSQCSSGGAEWLNGQNDGIYRDTGLLGGYVTVQATTVGTMSSGRPLYRVGSSTWKGLNYAALQVWRAYSSPATNYTSFKLDTPLDSTHFHVRVDNIRGDFLNWESQSVKGYLNGVQVAADFKDPVNGATASGSVISGASYTNTTTQSAMRVFFHGPVDSIVVQQTSVSDWIIAELMMECNVLLPASWIKWKADKTGTGILLSWQNATENGIAKYILEKSNDGMNFTSIYATALSGQHSLYSYADQKPMQGNNYYRLRSIYANGQSEYSTTLLVKWNQAPSQKIMVYPNPSNGQFSISAPGSKASGIIFDSEGKTMQRFSTTGAIQIDAGNWPKGEYIIRMDIGGSIQTAKLIRL